MTMHTVFHFRPFFGIEFVVSRDWGWKWGIRYRCDFGTHRLILATRWTFFHLYWGTRA